MAVRVFLSLLFATLLVASPFVQVVRCQSDADVDTFDSSEGDLGIVGDDIQDFGDLTLSSAPGVDTVCVFPHNSAHLVTAGKETEILVAVNNEGESALNVHGLRAGVHFSFDHNMVIQNLTVQEFYNSSVPVSTQATFPYVFTVSPYLQPGTYDLVATIFYEIDQHPYQSVFYNGTIEVVEVGSLMSMESVFLMTLAVALLGLLGIWVYGQLQNFSKKAKRVPKVEIGTATTDGDLDEWLKGTAYSQSQSNKSKKKK